MRTLTRQKLSSFRAPRRHRNPLTDAQSADLIGMAQGAWLGKVTTQRGTISREQDRLRDALRAAGVSDAALPGQNRAQLEESARVLAAAEFPQLKTVSREGEDPSNVADEFLKPFATWATTPEYADARKRLAEQIKSRREAAESKRASLPDVPKAIAEAELAAKKAQLERLRALREAAAQKAAEDEEEIEEEVEEEIEGEDEDEDEDEEEIEVVEVAEEPPKGRRSTRRSTRAAPEQSLALKKGEGVVTISRKGARLEGYARFLAPVRTTKANDASYKPPSDKVLAATRGDILLYFLKNGTTQVWIKGALTETFESSQGRSSWMAAKGYATEWLNMRSATGELKKSRLGTRVVFSPEDEPSRLDVVYESHNARKAKAEKVPSIEAIVTELREEGKKANPRTLFRNPLNQQIADQLRASFRRTNGIGTVLAGVGGFVAGTYAEAAFGLSKHFTRGGKASVKGAREVVRAAQERRLPEMPKLPSKPTVKTAKDFKPSARLAKLYREFNAYEAKKKAVPFAQAEKREQMEARLDEMWTEIEALQTQEMAAQGIRSNPRGLSVGQTLTVGYRTFTIVRVLPGEVVVAVDHGDGPEMYRVEETTKAAVLRSLGERFGNRSNPRKLAVPEYVAKTPRKLGERISAIGVKGKWPIGDLFHARLAAIYIMSPSHRAKKAQVLRALELNWPQYDWRGFLAKGESVRLRKVANPRQTTLQDYLLDDKLMYGRKLSLVRDDSFRGDRLDYKVMQKMQKVALPGGQNVWSADRTDIVLRFPAADTVEVYIEPRGEARKMVGSLRLRADASPEDGAVAVRNMLYSMTSGFSIAGSARYASIKNFFTESGYEPSTSVW